MLIFYLFALSILYTDYQQYIILIFMTNTSGTLPHYPSFAH